MKSSNPKFCHGKKMLFSVCENIFKQLVKLGREKHTNYFTKFTQNGIFFPMSVVNKIDAFNRNNFIKQFYLGKINSHLSLSEECFN